MTGREDLARVIGVSLFNDEQTPLSTGSRALNAADVALVHIAAVLHDVATVETLTLDLWDEGLVRPEWLAELVVERVLGQVAERLGVPHE